MWHTPHYMIQHTTGAYAALYFSLNSRQSWSESASASDECHHLTDFRPHIYSALTVHLLPLLTEYDHPAQFPVLLSMLIGPMQVVGRVLKRSVVSSESPTTIGKLTFVGLPAALLSLLLFGRHGWATAMFCVLYGLSGVLTIVHGIAPRSSLGGKLWRYFRRHSRTSAAGKCCGTIGGGPIHAGAPRAFRVGAFISWLCVHVAAVLPCCGLISTTD